MEPHNKLWKHMTVLYFALGTVCGDLEQRLIHAFGGDAKLLNEAPGGESVDPTHPTFVYVVYNTLEEQMFFYKQMRQRIMRSSAASVHTYRSTARVSESLKTE